MTDDPRADRTGPGPSATDATDDAEAPRHVGSDDPPDSEEPSDSDDERARAEELRRVVLHDSIRRERARRRGRASIWSWMGAFGLVGWTVAVPTLLGVGLGVYLDNRIDTSISFTITFLLVGAAVGMSMAWFWIRRESRGNGE